MRKGESRPIAARYGLHSTEVSKSVLRNLVKGSVPELDDLEPHHHATLKQVSDRYQQMLKNMAQPPRPRNLPIYELIKERYPEFNVVDLPGQPQVETYFRGFKPSLLSYLLGLVPEMEIANSAKVSRMNDGGVPMDVLNRCMDLLAREGACSLEQDEIQRFASWLGKGLEGEPLNLVSPVCPDYSYTEGESRKFRFTFESVNSGIGLAADRLLQSMPALRALWIDELNLPIEQHHIYLGDFEAFSKENCARLQVSCETFLQRLDGSRQTIADIVQEKGLVGMFCDLCGGESGWHATYADLKQRVEAGEFGDVNERLGVTKIADARRQLYQRWFVEAAKEPGFAESLVIAQGLEYATMGVLIQRSIRNPLVLAADHHRMAPFYNLAADIPVIYLDRNYE